MPLPEGELPVAVSTNPVLCLLTDAPSGTDARADIALSRVPLRIGALLPQKKYFAQKLSGYHTKGACVFRFARGLLYESGGLL